MDADAVTVATVMGHVVCDVIIFESASHRGAVQIYQKHKLMTEKLLIPHELLQGYIFC